MKSNAATVLQAERLEAGLALALNCLTVVPYGSEGRTRLEKGKWGTQYTEETRSSAETDIGDYCNGRC